MTIAPAMKPNVKLVAFTPNNAVPAQAWRQLPPSWLPSGVGSVVSVLVSVLGVLVSVVTRETADDPQGQRGRRWGQAVGAGDRRRRPRRRPVCHVSAVEARIRCPVAAKCNGQQPEPALVGRYRFRIGR